MALQSYDGTAFRYLGTKPVTRLIDFIPSNIYDLLSRVVNQPKPLDVIFVPDFKADTCNASLIIDFNEFILGPLFGLKKL